MYERNISGNFDSKESELNVVKRLLDKYGVEYSDIAKCDDADAGDIVVTAYGKQIIIEVKEEDYIKRFSRYGELGVDFISVFHFKPAVNRYKWRGVKNPDKYRELSEDIDEKRFKGGKIYYSKSHLWLFYSKYNDEFKYARFFDGKGMTSQAFKDYLFKNCSFAVNDKPADQLSHSDRYQSAVIFINGEDATLNSYRVDNLVDFIKNLNNI